MGQGDGTAHAQGLAASRPAQLEALDLERLESLNEELAFLTTREDLDAWLLQAQT
ncbi:MAG: hypothetical protein VKP72_10645 [bacterium]|nr:hypothetical protein [bacterium]